MCMYISWIWLVNFIDWKKFTIHFTITWKRTKKKNKCKYSWVVVKKKEKGLLKKRICPNDCSAYKKARQFKIKENYSTYSYKFSFVLFSLFFTIIYTKNRHFKLRKIQTKNENLAKFRRTWRDLENERKRTVVVIVDFGCLELNKNRVIFLQ